VLLFPPWCQVCHTENYVARAEFYMCKRSLKKHPAVLLLCQEQQIIVLRLFLCI